MNKKNLNEINPQLEVGDRVVLIHMAGGSVFTGTKGLVVGITPLPTFSKNDPEFGYLMNWFDDGERIMSRLSLIPNDDSWVYDKEYYKSNEESLNEVNNMFSKPNDLIKWADFFGVFGKSELNVICEFLELERRSGFSNMYSEGGRFLLTGPDYIKDFLKLKSYEKDFDERDKNIHKAMLSRAQRVRDIFIRGAMKYLEEKEQELEIPNIQKTMPRLATTAKEYWMKNADKYTTKEIE